MKKAVHIIQEKLGSLRVDGILITDLNNVRYLSGFTGSSGFIFITRDRAVFVTDFRYQEQAKRETRGFSIRMEKAGRPETIKALVDRYGINKLGFEDRSVHYRMYRELSEKKIGLKAVTDTVEDLRAIKSEEEIRLIKAAIQRAENAFRKLRPHIKTGITEQRLALLLEENLRREGCKSLPFKVIVASGDMSALPHAQPSSRVIKKGDVILFDWGGECEGYFSDMTRMVVFSGRHIRKQREIYSIALEAQRRAIRIVRPGQRCSSIDAEARRYIRGKGYGRYFGHGTGHGVGLEVHEKPSISRRSDTELKKGMVFTVEPGIYLPGFGGVRIEDVVAVTENGAEVLTTLPGTLEVL